MERDSDGGQSAVRPVGGYVHVFSFLVLLALLIPAIPASAELSEADGLLGISAREVSWRVAFPGQGTR